MTTSVQDLTLQIRKQIESFQAPVQAVDVGQILQVGDGIARISGLSNVMASELVEFPKTGVLGLTLKPWQQAGTAAGAEPFIELLITTRKDLRQAKQYQLADQVRARLEELGILLEDTPKGTGWKRKR